MPQWKSLSARPGGAVHRDEIAESHAEQPDAGQARRAHGEIVVLGIQLDDDGLFELEPVARRIRLDGLVHEIEHVGLEHGGFVVLQPQDDAVVVRSELVVRAWPQACRIAGALLGRQVRADDEIVEAVDEPQRVDDRRAVRVAAVRDREMLLRFGDFVLAQQIDAELGMCRVKGRLDLDGALEQSDRLAIAARDHIEIGGRRIDVAVARIELERTLGPLAVGVAAQQIGRRLERVDLQRRQVLLVGDFERRVELLVGRIDRAFLEIHARKQQVRFERLLRRLLDDLLEPFARLVVETAGRDLGETELGRHVVFVELEALLKQLDGFVVLMGLDEQLSPSRAHFGVLRILLERGLEVTVSAAQIAGRACRIGLDARIVAAAHEVRVAALRLDALAAIKLLVASLELGRTIQRVLDANRIGRARGTERENRQTESRGEPCAHGYFALASSICFCTVASFTSSSCRAFRYVSLSISVRRPRSASI